MHLYIYIYIYTGVSPPEELLASTSTGSLLYGSGVSLSYQATAPVTVNTISRLIYWYNNTINSIMVQSLDEDIISVGHVMFAYDCSSGIPVLVLSFLLFS